MFRSVASARRYREEDKTGVQYGPASALFQSRVVILVEFIAGVIYLLDKPERTGLIACCLSLILSVVKGVILLPLFTLSNANKRKVTVILGAFQVINYILLAVSFTEDTHYKHTYGLCGATVLGVADLLFFVESYMYM